MDSRQLFTKVVRKLLTTRFVPRDKYQKKRLRRLLKRTQQNSKFYRELYRDIDLNQITPFNIAELPAVTKAQLLENYDDVVCDSEITKEKVLEFTSDLDNIDKLFLDKYIIDSTSGTTGEKLKVVNDNKEFNDLLAMGAIYTWPKISYALDIATSNRPVVYIVALNGYHASVMISKAYLGLSNSYTSEILDFRMSTQELVDKLNSIDPILIGGYVSTFLILANEAAAGRLHINVKYMVAVGTAYSPEDKKYVEDTFNCKTFTTYSSTEAGEIACECTHGHYHLSKDVIVEPVDDDLNVIEDGKESSGILITNLWNTSMPFIRYLLNDHCIVHSEPCPCGCKTKWIEVIGREAFIVKFTNRNHESISLTGLLFESILDDACSGRSDHQMIIYDDRIEMRFNIQNDFIKYRQFKKIKQSIEEINDQHNLDIKVVLSDQLPVIGDSGKTKRILIKKGN